MVEHERIVARRAELGMSQAELARRVGISQPMIVEIEKGRVQTTKFVIEIARALDLQPHEIDPRYGEHAAPLQIISLEALGDLPIRRVVERSGKLSLLPTPIDSLSRPSMLASVRDAYAVLMPDDTMTPEFEPGDVLLIHPHLPPVSGHSYVFNEASEGAILIRRLTGQSHDRWNARVWNPPGADSGEATLARHDWPDLHRIIGKFSRG